MQKHLLIKLYVEGGMGVLNEYYMDTTHFGKVKGDFCSSATSNNNRTYCYYFVEDNDKNREEDGITSIDDCHHI